MHKALSLLLENKKSSKYSKKELEEIQNYVKEFHEESDKVFKKYGLVYQAKLKADNEAIKASLEVVPFDPSKLEQTEKSEGEQE